VRTPYRTPAGPDALQVTAIPSTVDPGDDFELTATIDDTRYESGGGSEPVQDVVGAAYYVDVPPWVDGSPPGVGMIALDGVFDEPVEAVTAFVSSTGLAPGRHIVFVRGRDADGNWGAFGATFIGVTDDQADDDGDGVANGDDCLPGNGSVWSAPSPARDLRVSTYLPGNLTWSPPAAPGADAVGYQVLRSTAADDFEMPLCILAGTQPMATDSSIPSAGELFHYLVRTANRCGENLGTDSAGQPRTAGPCQP
jgi:hypothetical protein